ncbi:MAG: hypothetical protein ACR2QC_04230 [Gammaproteobacteria bacterium]
MKYYWDKDLGKWIERPWLPPQARLHIISDSHSPFRSMADGQMYDSKSAYRADLAARGFREMGNERPIKSELPDQTDALEREIHRAIEEGPQSGISAPDGFREDLV